MDQDALAGQDTQELDNAGAQVDAGTSDTQSAVDANGGATEAMVVPGTNTRAFLETLSDTPAAEVVNGGEGAAASGIVDPNTVKEDRDAQVESEEKPSVEGQADTEEAGLLEGVKSERGRERIQSMLSQKKELESDIAEFRGMIQSTGMSPDQFAQTLEFGRLVSSGDEKNLRTALGMLDQQRAAIASKLGIEVPGFDPLRDHEDLSEAVEGMEMTREHALELAKLRKQSTETQQRQRAQQLQQVNQQQYQQELQSVGQSMQTFFESRMHEADHKVRWGVVESYFRNRDNVNKFVQTYQPNQWMAAMQMMYDGVQIQRPAVNAPQPIRSRPVNLGAPNTGAATEIERLDSRLQQLGI